MVVGNESYVCIREKLNRMLCSTQDLNHMKYHFRCEIDSEREFDRITNIQKLIRILERRDCLNESNVACFRFIAEVLNRTDIIDLVNNYGNGNIRSPQEELQSNSYVLPIRNENNLQVPVLPYLPEDPIERVFDLICSEIGQRWKDFARALEVREGRIDELEERHRTVRERVREILRYHRQNAGEQMWRLRMMNALDKSRRQDLRLDVQLIFAQNNMM